MATEKGSAIRALIKRKKTILSDFFKPVFTATLRPPCGHRLEPAFSCVESDLPGPLPGEAIRSVSHLDLARLGLMPRLPPISNRKERTRRLRPCSLRLGFIGQPFYNHTRPLWQARAFTNPAPTPPRAGPENFQCRAAFIQFQRAMVPVRGVRLTTEVTMLSIVAPGEEVKTLVPLSIAC